MEADILFVWFVYCPTPPLSILLVSISICFFFYISGMRNYFVSKHFVTLSQKEKWTSEPLFNQVMTINGIRMVPILDKAFGAGISEIKQKCMPSWFVVLYYSRVLGTVEHVKLFSTSKLVLECNVNIVIDGTWITSLNVWLWSRVNALSGDST